MTLNLTHTAVSQSQQEAGVRTPLDGLTLHPSVLRADWQDLGEFCVSFASLTPYGFIF